MECVAKKKHRMSCYLAKVKGIELSEKEVISLEPDKIWAFVLSVQGTALGSTWGGRRKLL
jgi:hypothetical protein